MDGLKCNFCYRNHHTLDHHCSVCGQSGHPARYHCDYCKQLHARKNHVCQRCGVKGHDLDMHKCKTCGSVEHERHPCDVCGVTGHSQYDHCTYCDKLSNHTINEPCNKCHRAGHCADAPHCSACNEYHSLDDHVCSHCEGTGHQAANACPCSASLVSELATTRDTVRGLEEQIQTLREQLKVVLVALDHHNLL